MHGPGRERLGRVQVNRDRDAPTAPTPSRSRLGHRDSDKSESDYNSDLVEQLEPTRTRLLPVLLEGVSRSMFGIAGRTLVGTSCFFCLLDSAS